MRRIAALLVSIATVLLALTTTTTATAVAAPHTTASLQRQITQILRQHPGGTQISPTRIAWNNGAVVLDLSAPVSRATTSLATSSGAAVSPAVTIYGCPAGYYCFYDLRDFGGQMLEISACLHNPPIYLSNYGFAHKTSSWVVNRSIYEMNVYEQGPGYWIWVFSTASYAAASYVGASADNLADIVDCYTSA
jgi:hypothetical protein